MFRSIVSWFLAVVAIFMIVVGIGFATGQNWLIGSGEAASAAGGIATRTYGRSNESYRFKVREAVNDPVLDQCVVCHSLEKNGPYRVAPNLWGIVGAKKARAKWYGYSRALENAKGEWTKADLDKYLTSPSAYLPGTTKTLSGFSSPEERTKLIAALSRLSD